ncbi:MAG: sodium:proton antiporter [candidate division Zixibacteria bacterium]
MTAFNAIAILLSLAAVLAYVNHRFVKLPSTVGMMVIALGISFCLIILNRFGLDISSPAEYFLSQIDFSEVLMKGMLSFLLFAGALKINLNDLAQQKYIIGSLATIGVVMSTFIVGSGLYFILSSVDLSIPYIYCLVFGALISPTDPVAVLGIMKTVKVPKTIETKIAGESLFNDGVGVVVFMVMVGIATSGGSVSFGHVGYLLLTEVVGGILFGAGIGWLAYMLLKDVDDYSVEVLITLGLVCGGYALAHSLHTSGPIAIVVAGLLIGNYGRNFAMSEKTRDHLDKFWELIDEILNAVLFVWIGLEVLILTFDTSHLIVGLAAIVLVLFGRFSSVYTVINLLRFRRQFSNNAVAILTWGGLRGGISIALALSLSQSPARDLIVTITYLVVIFSILVQGLTIQRLAKSEE